MRRSRNRASRTGFTLVELLVVVAIIGILIAMLLPAIQFARESARRTSCMSQMRQIAMAIRVYEQEKGIYPPVQHQDPNWGIIAVILPYMEGMSLYRKLDFDLDWNDPVNEEFTTIEFPVVRCPSAPRAATAVSDYAAATEIEKDADIAALVDDGRIEDRGGASNKKWDGILQYDYKTSSSSVKDGLSNTFLFFEDAGRPWFFENGVQQACDFDSSTDPPPCPSGASWGSQQSYFVIDEHDDGRFMNVTNQNEVYSFHPGGAVFAFGDSGARFHAQDMDPETFVRHVTRNDGIGVFGD